MNRFLSVFFGAALLLIAAGCRSDQHYQNRAVERARAYLLEHASELTPEEIYYVKFNDPVLLSGPIIGDTTRRREEERLNSEQRQICVSWRIPERDETYMVYGASGGNMEYWYPVRLIRKRFDGKLPPEEVAITAARSYALDNLYGQLSSAELNSVRFQKPVIAVTDFKLNLNPDGTLDEAALAKVRETVGAQSQISLAWPSPDRPDRVIVFCGLASGGKFSGWSINFAGVMDKSEFDSGVVKRAEPVKEGEM